MFVSYWDSNSARLVENMHTFQTRDKKVSNSVIVPQCFLRTAELQGTKGRQRKQGSRRKQAQGLAHFHPQSNYSVSSDSNKPHRTVSRLKGENKIHGWRCVMHEIETIRELQNTSKIVRSKRCKVRSYQTNNNVYISKDHKLN